MAKGISGDEVVRALEKIAAFQGYPTAVRTDQGPEFTGKSLDRWAYEHNVALKLIQAGKSTQNAYIESFNGKFRDEYLNKHWFRDLIWRCKYHIVWTPKYRFKILRGNVGHELYRSIYILCNMKDCEVLELNIQPDHVHLVVIVPPKVSISTLMGVLKGRSAIRLFNKFPHIRKKLWGNHFWARGYFVDTVGVNEDITRRYVRHQDKKDQEYEAQLELKVN